LCFSSFMVPVPRSYHWFMSLSKRYSFAFMWPPPTVSDQNLAESDWSGSGEKQGKTETHMSRSTSLSSSPVVTATSSSLMIGANWVPVSSSAAAENSSSLTGRCSAGPRKGEKTEGGAVLEHGADSGERRATGNLALSDAAPAPCLSGRDAAQHPSSLFPDFPRCWLLLALLCWAEPSKFSLVIFFLRISPVAHPVAPPLAPGNPLCHGRPSSSVCSNGENSWTETFEP
jgi:hypothetical protein